jgi:hypothetical protein
MSGQSFRTLTNVTLILFEETVELFISRTIPTGNIVHLFATDSVVTATDTNNSQTWKLSKIYKQGTKVPDTLYVRVTCSNGTTPTPPFFSIAYTYEVTVIDARFHIPLRELVLLTPAHNNTENPRSIEHFYNLPVDIGVVSMAPSLLDDPNPLSTFEADDDDIDADQQQQQQQHQPVVSVVPVQNAPGRYRVRVLQQFGQPGTNTITFTLLYGRFNAYRTYVLTYVVKKSEFSIGGYAAVPFLVDMMSYDKRADHRITARYISPSLSPSSSQFILNSPERFQTALGPVMTSPLPPAEFYGVGMGDLIDEVVDVMNKFPLVKLKRQSDMLYFEADNRSTTARYEIAIARQIDFDNGAWIRVDPTITQVFGFMDDVAKSKVSDITGLQTIRSSRVFTRVVPPIISLELESVTNQQEGAIRQAESVRLFTFYLADNATGYNVFNSPNMYPARALDAATSTRTNVLKFHFRYNRMLESSSRGTRGVGLPVQFLEPYYVTLRVVSRGRDNKTSDSFIVLTGIDSSPTVELDAPLNNVVLVEVMEARIPKQPEPPATVDNRRAILGYVVDKALPMN